MGEMSDERFFAWLDGELTGTEAEEVAARVAADPELTARAEQHRALHARLHAAFDPVAEALVPQGIAAALRTDDPSVVSIAGVKAARRERAARPRWLQAAAMAATLAIGILVGNVLSPDPVTPVESKAGRLVAASSLEEALTTQLASAPADDGPRVGLTFQDAAGTICRTFTDRTASGLACFERGDWHVRGLFQASEGQGGDYRMAAGMDPGLAALLDETITGEPFDADQERAAQARGWR